jgi:hypothetical protein|tara:strand:- start:26 stop:217 length:192 start_codon:yes stop_codon:yes gene_type:complete
MAGLVGIALRGFGKALKLAKKNKKEAGTGVVMAAPLGDFDFGGPGPLVRNLKRVIKKSKKSKP